MKGKYKTLAQLAVAIVNNEINERCCQCCEWKVIDEWENHKPLCRYNSLHSLGGNFYIDNDKVLTNVCNHWELNHNLFFYINDIKHLLSKI